MMTLRKKRNQINKKLIPTLLLVLVLTICMSIGYSSFSVSLVIKDVKSTVRTDKNVRVIGVSQADTSHNNGGSSQNEEYNVGAIQADIRLPQSNSQVTYEVTVKNYGNVEMGIKNISLPTSLRDILDVTVTGYTVGDKLRDDNDSCESSVDGCKLSISRSFYVTLSYKNGAYNSNNVVFNNAVVNFEFAEAHKVNYVGFTVLHPDMQAHCVLDGNTYSYNIGPHDALQVRIDGVATTNYTIDSNNLLTVPNVTGELDVIIAEIMVPVDITVVPNTATISYKVNGIDQTPVTGELETEIALGSTIDIEVTCYGYKKVTRSYRPNIDLDVTITMDQVFYLDIATIPSDATIHYTVNGQARDDVVSTLSGEYDPGTVIYMTITRDGYKTETRNYTMNEHKNEVISLAKLYTLTVNATPSDSSILLTYGGNNYGVTTGYSVILPENTSISITVSRDGYKTETRNISLTTDKTETFDLIKQYTYTINVTKPTDADIYVTLNNGTAQKVNNGTSMLLDSGTTISTTVSKDKYISQTTSHTLTQDITDTISLLRIYSYTVSTNLNDALVTITYDGQDYTGSKSKKIDVTEGASVSWTITRDYYQKQTGSDSNIQSDLTRGSDMSLNAVKSASGSKSDDMGINENATTTLNIPSGAKIISVSTSGSFRVSLTNQALKVITTASNGHQFWSKSYKGKTFSNTSISNSYSCSNYTTNIDSCPAEGTVTTNLTKPTAIIVYVSSALTTSVQYIEK